MDNVKQQVVTPDILSLWAQYLQERRRSLLTELKAVEQQQEQLATWLAATFNGAC